MDDAEQEIFKKNRKLVFKLSNFDERDIDKETMLTYTKKLEEIEGIHEDLDEGIQKLLIDHGTTMGHSKATEWQAKIVNIQNDVRTHRQKITRKVSEVKNCKSQPVPVDSTSGIEAENLDLLQQLEIYEKIGPHKTSKSIMSPEDSEIAEKHQEGDIENVDEKDLDEEDSEDISEIEPEDEVFDNMSDLDGVSAEGDTFKIGDIVSHPKLDLLEVPLKKPNFSKRIWGRLLLGTQVYEGSFMNDMEKFVTKKLTRRMILSKNAFVLQSVLDTWDKYLPTLAGLKIELSQADLGTRLGFVLDSDDKYVLDVFDDAVPDELNAVPSEINLTTARDAAKLTKGEIGDDIERGIQTPPRNLSMNDEEESFEEGLVFENSQETPRKTNPAVLMNTRVEEGSEVSKHINKGPSNKSKVEKVMSPVDENTDNKTLVELYDPGGLGKLVMKDEKAYFMLRDVLMIPKLLCLTRSLFHFDEENWQAAMDQDELLKAMIKGDESEQDYTMSHLGKGLRFRLTGGYDDPESQFGVQHRLLDKVARSELLKSCELCCCSSSCSLTGHGDFSPEVLAYKGLQEFKYTNLLDRSLMELDDYQEEMFSFLFEQDKFMSVLSTVDADETMEIISTPALTTL